MKGSSVGRPFPEKRKRKKGLEGPKGKRSVCLHQKTRKKRKKKRFTVARRKGGEGRMGAVLG